MCDDFPARIAPHLEALRAYCNQLAGRSTTWDAEDLLQETMTRAYRAYMEQPDRSLHRTYLKRIAKHVWIDHWRQQRQRLNLEGHDVMSASDKHGALTIPLTAVAEPPDSSFAVSPEEQLSLRANFEWLADQLSIRQMVLILLLDVFRFTARETALLLRLTEGAVKEGVKRARRRLHQLAAQAQEEQNSPSKRKERTETAERVSGRQLEAFLQAFRAGNPQAICESYLALATQGIRVVEVNRMADRLQFVFRDPDGHLIGFFSEILA